jgi:hypothetical protein
MAPRKYLRSCVSQATIALSELDHLVQRGPMDHLTVSYRQIALVSVLLGTFVRQEAQAAMRWCAAALLYTAQSEVNSH